MNAQAADPKILYSLGLRFRAATTALNRHFGEGIAEVNPYTVVTTALLIELIEMMRAQRELAERQTDALNAIREEMKEHREDARDGLVMLCDTVRELDADEAIAGVRRAIDALTVEVAAVAVAINSASVLPDEG